MGVVGVGSLAQGGHSPGGPGCLGIADPEGLSQGEDAIQRCLQGIKLFFHLIL